MTKTTDRKYYSDGMPIPTPEERAERKARIKALNSRIDRIADKAEGKWWRA